MEEKIKNIIIEIINDKGDSVDVSKITCETKLRDLGLSSFDLATLTVKIEDMFGVDIFENGLIETFGEIISIVNQKK